VNSQSLAYLHVTIMNQQMPLMEQK